MRGRSAEVPASVMREETEAAINRLKKNQSPSIDNISAEEFQAAEQSGVDVMLLICRKIWEDDKFPKMWKQTFKKKDKYVVITAIPLWISNDKRDLAENSTKN